MLREHDVVKLKRSVKTTDIEGDQVSVRAGAKGTVMYTRGNVSECLVEFGHIATNAFMILVNKKDLQAVWSPPNDPGFEKWCKTTMATQAKRSLKRRRQHP